MDEEMTGTEEKNSDEETQEKLSVITVTSPLQEKNSDEEKQEKQSVITLTSPLQEKNSDEEKQEKQSVIAVTSPLQGMQEDCLKSVSALPTSLSKAVGVLRFSLESDARVFDSRDPRLLPVSQHLTEPPVKCEYCGEKRWPSLDLTWADQPESASTLFCCARHQQLCEILLSHRHQVHSDFDTLTPLDNMAVAELENVLRQRKVMEKKRKQAQERAQRNAAHHPENCIRFKYSNWFLIEPRLPRGPKVVLCDHNKPFQFGISYQGGKGFLQKYYSSGMKFLTVFPDDSAEVFYPSGHLALVVVVTEEGRVCIVYDDSHVPKRPIMAVFQSDGRATCYHSNGNIRLSLNTSGGQCLDEAGAMVQRWTWSTPLRPVFLSLNRMVGVRVLGQKKVFVSFLACGRQAKFRLGVCCVQQVESIRGRAAAGPSITKEELFLMAGRMRIQKAIKCIHQCLKRPSNLRPVRATPAPRRCVIQKLLDASENVHMSERERAFIHRCLQEVMYSNTVPQSV